MMRYQSEREVCSKRDYAEKTSIIERDVKWVKRYQGCMYIKRRKDVKRFEERELIW